MVRPRRSPYKSVEVRGLIWEGHNHQMEKGPVLNADQELHMVLNAFREYEYNAKRMVIPQDSDKRSGFPSFLQNKLVTLAASSPKTLIVVYYQGHGSVDKHGHLSLSNGNGQRMHWSDIANAIINVKCDVLAILNCCHAGAAMNDRLSSRPNYERRVKQVMMSTSADMKSTWGSSSGFAACLEQALRDKRNNWREDFRGIPRQWANSINHVMKKKKPESENPVSVGHLIKPPEPSSEDAPKREIILSPLSVC